MTDSMANTCVRSLFPGTTLLLLAFAIVGCSSGGEGSEIDDTSGDKGPDSVAAVPGTGTGAAADLNLSGMSNGTSSSGTWGARPQAEDTQDGLFAISPAQSTALRDPESSCAAWTATAQAQPSVLEFILDVSGSMDEKTASTGKNTKWEATRDALRLAITDLNDSVASGLSFFPNLISKEYETAQSVDACVNTKDNVPIGPLTREHRQALQDALDDVSPKTLGATPTQDAFAIAVQRLTESQSSGHRYAVLITDGQPTQSKGCMGVIDMCSPQPTGPIVDAIAAARSNHGIDTFVVGSPGSEANVCTGADVRSWLSQAARAGGTGASGCSEAGTPFCHFDLSLEADFAQGLNAALSSIAQSVISCSYRLPAPAAGQVIDPGKVNLVYNDGSGGEFLILPSGEADCSRGWQYSAGSAEEIEICGTTCDLLRANSNAQLSLAFGCTSGQVPLQ